MKTLLTAIFVLHLVRALVLGCRISENGSRYPRIAKVSRTEDLTALFTCLAVMLWAGLLL